MKNKFSILALTSLILATATFFITKPKIESPDPNSRTQITLSETQTTQKSKPSDEPLKEIDTNRHEAALPEVEETPKTHPQDKTAHLWLDLYGVAQNQLEFYTPHFEYKDPSQDNPLEGIIKLKVNPDKIEQLTIRPRFQFNWKGSPISEFDKLGPGDYETWRQFEDPSIKTRALAGLRTSITEIDLVRELKNDVPDLTTYRFYEFNKPTPVDEDTSNENQENWMELNASAGFKASLGKRNIPRAGIYTTFQKPSFLGYKPVERARIGVNTEGLMEFSLQKELLDNWRAELATQASPLGLNGTLYFSREIQNRSRTGISVGDGQSGTFLNLNYILLY